MGFEGNFWRSWIPKSWKLITLIRIWRDSLGLKVVKKKYLYGWWSEVWESSSSCWVHVNCSCHFERVVVWDSSSVLGVGAGLVATVDSVTAGRQFPGVFAHCYHMRYCFGHTRIPLPQSGAHRVRENWIQWKKTIVTAGWLMYYPWHEHPTEKNPKWTVNSDHCHCVGYNEHPPDSILIKHVV